MHICSRTMQILPNTISLQYEMAIYDSYEGNYADGLPMEKWSLFVVIPSRAYIKYRQFQALPSITAAVKCCSELRRTNLHMQGGRTRCSGCYSK